MSLSLADHLLRREIADPYRYSGFKGLYGHKAWVDDLDIVNELGGHTGCVNALSWSKSGQLLASGSDDTHLNIHTYQPENSTAPFTLSTTLATGHTANIFSVKFMPHSNDNTLISCAGDGQVRVFDIEYAGRHAGATHITPSSARHHSGVNLEELYRGVQFLSPASTNAKVYRSHGDRVKRIVTESSPHLFLTCSEDGEVRQWDLRLPSSAYPPPRGPRRGVSGGGGDVPPPLISYKRHRLDLNTISCSASQPHYIVLGGAHLHAFLHDRRMLGRDPATERGTPPVIASSNMTESEEELMGKATKCVRRFAPNGKRKMTRTDNGHITACKISDANPNEMIGSWSGDHIYSFDLVASPDAHEAEKERSNGVRATEKARRAKESQDRKRKRRAPQGQPSSTSIEGLARGEARARSANLEGGQTGDVALRVRYGNGQSEDIPFQPSARTIEQVHRPKMNQMQERAVRIAKSVVKIRKLLFSLESSSHSEQASGISHHTPSFSDCLGQAATVLPEMDSVSSAWTYPLNPTPGIVNTQKTLSANRAAARRFVQAAGSLARILGGNVRSVDEAESRIAVMPFLTVESPPSASGPASTPWQEFCYTFLTAILAWLDGGTPTLLARFKRESTGKGELFIPTHADEGAIHEILVPNLLELANQVEQKPIINIGANRFETAETRMLFRTGADAVIAWSHAIVTPIQSSVSTIVQVAASGSASSTNALASSQVHHRDAALKYWGFKVGRGLLMAAAEGVNYAFVNRAFGGVGLHTPASEGRSQQEVNTDESEERIQSVSVLHSTNGSNENHAPETGTSRDMETDTNLVEEGEGFTAEELHRVLDDDGLESEDTDNNNHNDDNDNESNEFGEMLMEGLGEGDEIFFGEDEGGGVDNNEDEAEAEDSNEDDDDEEEDGDTGDSEDDVNEGVSESEEDPGLDPRRLFVSASSLRHDRENVEADVPCSTHTRIYRGHCNVKTVKDVNFFGLNDEYVVSGSDSGHLFIWDRRSSHLVNVLQGDGEVVNVVQGHPYEPMLAVSGIDHTIKIFSPDARAQTNARRGIDLATSYHRSHGVGIRSRLRISQNQSQNPSGTQTPHDGDPSRSTFVDPATEAAHATAAWEAEDDIAKELPTNGGLATCRRMHENYQITSQNDVDRQGGLEDAFFTRSMLAQIAAHIRARRAAGVQNPNGDDHENDDWEDETLILEENCSVM